MAIFLSHFVSCMWYWVGDSEEADGWVAKTFECDPIAQPVDCIHGGAEIGDRYLATYWWAITLLLTAELTNHIHPHSNGEIVSHFLHRIVHSPRGWCISDDHLMFQMDRSS